ncbi:putative zinc finger, CCHC-type containing protein [Tanacetum coccineum]
MAKSTPGAILVTTIPIKASDPSSAQTSSSPPCSLCPETVSSPSVAPTTEPTPSTAAPMPPPQAHTPPLATLKTPTPPPVVSATNIHHMTTRSRAEIFKTKHIADLAELSKSALHVALLSHKEPKGYKSTAKNSKWVAAMNNEMPALWSNNTWDFVPRTAESNVVGSKWVFRIKYLSDGFIDRYKARLVAQGFTQVPGLDYSHTFSHVVKASTVRIVLSLAVLNNCSKPVSMPLTTYAHLTSHGDTFLTLLFIAHWALANTASKVVWITSLLRELHVSMPSTPTLLCDNKSAIFLSQNPVAHKCAKHIDIDYHFVRELVSSKCLLTRLVPSKHKVAAIFTKSLPRPLFEFFRSKLCVGLPPPRLKGVLAVYHLYTMFSYRACD